MNRVWMHGEVRRQHAEFARISHEDDSQFPSAPRGLRLVFTLPPRASTTAASALDFVGGNLVVYRVGDGAAAPGANATALFLDEYAPAGGSPVRSVAMPTTGVGANKRLVAKGNDK